MELKNEPFLWYWPWSVCICHAGDKAPGYCHAWYCNLTEDEDELA